MKKSCLKISIIGLILSCFLFCLRPGNILADETELQVTNVILSVNQEGEIKEVEQGQNVDYDQIYQVVYHYAIPDNFELKEGDKMEVMLPEVIQVFSDTPFKLIDASKPEKPIVGEGIVKKDTGQIEIIFNAYMVGKVGRNGTFSFWVQHQKDKVEAEKALQIDFKVKQYDVQVGGSRDKENAIHKSAVFAETDPDIIEWTIMLKATHDDFKNLTFHDTLQKINGSIEHDFISVEKEGKHYIQIKIGDKEEEIALEDDQLSFEKLIGDLTKGDSVTILVKTKVKEGADIGTFFGNEAKYIKANAGTSSGQSSITFIRKQDAQGTGSGYIQKQVILRKVDEHGNSINAHAGQDLKAVFNLYKEDGTLLEESLTTNEDGEIVLTDLIPGHYYFIETKAPEGYQINREPVYITVTEIEDTVIEHKNSLLPMTINILLSKQEINSTEELPGAHLELSENNQIIETWISAQTAKEFKLEQGKTYMLTEKIAPANYELTEAIIFRVNDAGELEVKENEAWVLKTEHKIIMKNKLKSSTIPTTTATTTIQPSEAVETPNKSEMLPKTGEQQFPGGKIFVALAFMAVLIILGRRQGLKEK